MFIDLARRGLLIAYGIERWKHLERSIYRFSRQLAEQLAKFFLRVVGIVHFAGYPACLIAHGIHKLVDFGCIEWTSLTYVYQKIFECHTFLFLSIGFEVILEERNNPVEWNHIHLVVKVGVISSRNNEQLFVFSFQFFESIFAKVA